MDVRHAVDVQALTGVAWAHCSCGWLGHTHEGVLRFPASVLDARRHRRLNAPTHYHGWHA